eukprot:scaffold79681_cov69-Phaeocystis_antarctica.AAC.2
MSEVYAVGTELAHPIGAWRAQWQPRNDDRLSTTTRARGAKSCRHIVVTGMRRRSAAQRNYPGKDYQRTN